jgi:hypothetical protein
MEILRKIKEEVILERFDSYRLEKALLPSLRDAFDNRFDVKYHMEEILLRDTDIVRRERDGEKLDKETLELEKKTLEIIRYCCIFFSLVSDFFVVVPHRCNILTCSSLSHPKVVC